MIKNAKLTTSQMSVSQKSLKQVHANNCLFKVQCTSINDYMYYSTKLRNLQLTRLELEFSRLGLRHESCNCEIFWDAVK